MIEAVTLFVIAVGAVVVSIASMIRMAWLGVLVPVLIAAGATGALIVLLRRRRPRRVRTEASRTPLRTRKADDQIVA